MMNADTGPQTQVTPIGTHHSQFAYNEALAFSGGIEGRDKPASISEWLGLIAL